MKTYSQINKEVVEALKNGEVGIIPTDTIFGFVASAFKVLAVEKIYKIKKREKKKPFIILISSIEDLKKFGIRLNEKHLKILKRLWPVSGSFCVPVSVILPCKNKKFYYLHRGTDSLAFRLPQLPWLRSLIKNSGPIVAPSANFSGEKPASNAKEVQKVFDNKIDFCINKKTIGATPSTIIQILR